MINNTKITDIFAMNLFNDANMKKYLSNDVYRELKDTIDNNKQLDVKLADQVAIGLKNWAIENGVTHYTHWFQPLTGTSAEKHDAFISIDKKGKTILEFKGKNLCRGETDASSFPTGGIRATFEARGYTLWDVTSPAFIKSDTAGNKILYIPTAFCSYNGEALDKKTPLLRSMVALNKSAMKLLKILGIEANMVQGNVGAEQEYFLIDRKDYMKRDDLRFCNRTLFGVLPPKAKETGNHYYGNIKDRVSKFMAEVNQELWKLGITAKTEHNEVAPCQHELVPIFSTTNIATDQNQIIMEMLKSVAERHKLTCILHEKPFMGINGSGKHNNWSLTTDTGINLLKPSKSKDVKDNLLYLLTLIAIISAVDEYSALLRMSAANPGNDHRLGRKEAPPAIISIFIGDEVENIFESILNSTETIATRKKALITGVSTLPDVSQDYSDRNRTSPFALTGEKFEFRMVGSSATLANPNTILNTITAEYFDRISKRLENCSKDCLVKESYEIIKDLYAEHKKIIYKGNNYSKEWVRESRQRGLLNIKNCVDAYDCMVEQKSIDLFSKHNVLTEKELKSRREIYLQNYIDIALIEKDTLIEMLEKQILPHAFEYTSKLAQQISNIEKINSVYTIQQEEKLDTISKAILKLNGIISKLNNNSAKLSKYRSIRNSARFVRDNINVLLSQARENINILESKVPQDSWPLPTYKDILYYEE